MAQSLDQKAAIRYAPEDLKKFIAATVKGYKFKLFLAADNWNKKPKSQWVISVSATDVVSMGKKLGTKPVTVGSKKIVDFTTASGYKLRFRESSKKAGSKAPDAKTTAMQEKASAYIFEYVLNKRSTSFKSEKEMSEDKVLMKNLTSIYPDVEDSDWLSVYFKQHKVILDKFGKSNINKFDHTGGFMAFIGDLIKKNFGISKKDNWNPADIWGVVGDSKQVIKTLEKTVFGSKDSQTISQLNAVMRGMYKEKKLVGISLKKVSGKQALWQEYNIEKLTLDEIDEYKFPKIDIEINLSANMTQDTKVKLRKMNGTGYNFQIKANTSTEFSGLKWESTPKGAGAARGGKAQVDSVVTLLDDNNKSFEKNNRKYPQDATEFSSNSQTYKEMFKRVNKKVETDCENENEFATNIENLFMDKPYVANSKLMQLTFIDKVLSIDNKEKFTEFWTDMVFLSIKKGDKFGPFGKLY